MAISFVGYVSGSSDGSVTGAYSVALSSFAGGVAASLQQGDVLLCINAAVSSGADLDVGPTPIGDWTELFDLYIVDTRRVNLSVAWKAMGASPDTTVTVQGPADSNNASATFVLAFRGVDTTTPIDVASTTATNFNGNNANAPAITPVTEGSWIVAAMAGTEGSPVGGAKTGPANMTDFQQLAAAGVSNGIRASFALLRTWSSGAFDPGVLTGGTSGSADTWAAGTIALREGTVFVGGGGLPARAVRLAGLGTLGLR